MKRFSLVRAALCAAILGLAATAAHAADGWCSSGKPVRFASITWESGSFTTEVLRQILEKGYGCKTDVIPGDSLATNTALANNDLQVWAEQWSGRSAIADKAVAAGKVKNVGDTLPGGTVEGWFVPEYVIRGDPKRGIRPSAPDLVSVLDLDKYKAVFVDDEEPDKGRFLNCPAAWRCQQVNTRLLKALKLDDAYVDFRPGTGGALDAAITSAYLRGKPILFYYWGPAALMAKYKLVALKMPAYNDSCWATLQGGSTAQPCASSYKVSHISISVSTPFYVAEPRIMDMFNKVKLPMSLLDETALEMNERKTSAAEMANAFLRSHPEIWKSWVPAEVAAKIQAALK
jgi:glycine betaine/proline transport system substrate-binding protein